METQLPNLRMNETSVFVPVTLPVNPALFTHSSVFLSQNSLILVIFICFLVFYLHFFYLHFLQIMKSD